MRSVTSQANARHTILQISSWDGYLIASQSSSTLGASTSAQDLLRKRYLGISGSNKLVGALEIQQVPLMLDRPIMKLAALFTPGRQMWGSTLMYITGVTVWKLLIV